MKDVLQEELLTYEEVEKKFKVSRSMVVRWINAGKLKPVYFGERSPRIPISQLKALIYEK